MDPIILMVALASGALVLTVFLAISKSLSTTGVGADFQRNLALINESELTERDPEPTGAVAKWFTYWDNMSARSGRRVSPHAAGRNVIIVAVLVALFCLLVLPYGVIIAVVAVAATPLLARIFFNSLAQRRAQRMDRQLPLLLTQMISNLQANSTPQQALLSVVDEIPSPLGEELNILRDDLTVGMSVSAALQRLASRVPSREMKFLVSSIEIASIAGSDLEPQLYSIAEILERRQDAAAKLKSAISEISLTLWAAAIVVPGAAIVSFVNKDNTDFWLSLQGLIAAGAGLLLYAGSLITSRVIIQGIKKF